MTSKCHDSPMYGNRCSTCGHRQTVNGVKPGQTRDIMKRNPGFLFTELRGRYQAKAYGRHLLSNDQFSQV